MIHGDFEPCGISIQNSKLTQTWSKVQVKRGEMKLSK